MNAYLCKRDSSKECEGKYKDCTDCILDKIRVEIKGMTPTYHNFDWSITDLVPISEVLKIVDKYKAESEDKNEDCN